MCIARSQDMDENVNQENPETRENPENPENQEKPENSEAEKASKDGERDFFIIDTILFELLLETFFDDILSGFVGYTEESISNDHVFQCTDSSASIECHDGRDNLVCFDQQEGQLSD